LQSCLQRCSLGAMLLSLATLFICTAPAVAQQRKTDPEVEAILRERVKVLREAADLLQDRHKNGGTNVDQVMDAERAVIEAELDLALSTPERIKLLEKLVENATAFEKLVERRHEVAAASTVDLRVATAIRLRAQADLLLAKKSAPRG
jgi:outer membrane protein TolC